jgi:hypothetical protein
MRGKVNNLLSHGYFVGVVLILALEYNSSNIRHWC